MKLEERPDLMKRVINIAHKFFTEGTHGTIPGRPKYVVIGSLFHGVEDWESMVAELTAARLGSHIVPLQWSNFHRSSVVELLHQFKMMSSSVDLTLVSCIDRETLGGGRALIESLENIAPGPLINVGDEIYGHQAALAELLAVSLHRGDLCGANLHICWGFGNRFTVPAMPHSLCLLGSALGAEITVCSPREFSLMRRVIRRAQELASENGGEVSESHDISDSVAGADVVIVTNWCSLDDYMDIEKNARRAQRYSEWTFGDNIEESILFLTPPPVQCDLLATEELVKRYDGPLSSWMLRRVSVLAATVHELSRIADGPPVVI